VTSPFLGSGSTVPRGQLRGKRYTKLGRDLFVLRDAEVSLLARVEAARLVFPDGVPCLSTSALLLNLPADDDGLIHLDRGPKAARSRRSDIKVHRLGIPEEQLHDLDGLMVADGPRILADLSDSLPLEALVALGDVVARRWKDHDIARAVELHGKRRGAVLLKQAVPLLDRGADSPAETRMRLRLHAAGFVRLKHKVVVRDVGGGWLGEPDLADEVAMVGVQHEGAVHFEKGEQQRKKDVGRDEVLRAEGWQIVISTSEDDQRPHRLVEKLTAAYLRQARLLGPHVLPDVLRTAQGRGTVA
jgi:hypothetical protein